jgi:hypothetical protein
VTDTANLSRIYSEICVVLRYEVHVQCQDQFCPVTNELFIHEIWVCFKKNKPGVERQVFPITTQKYQAKYEWKTFVKFYWDVYK